MRQVKQNSMLFLSIILMTGCVSDNTKLTTALTDGVTAGITTTMDNNSSKKDEGLSEKLKQGAISGVQVGLKSALEDNTTKDANSSGTMTTQIIDSVANHLKGKKEE